MPKFQTLHFPVTTFHIGVFLKHAENKIYGVLREIIHNLVIEVLSARGSCSSLTLITGKVLKFPTEICHINAKWFY